MTQEGQFWLTAYQELTHMSDSPTWRDMRDYADHYGVDLELMREIVYRVEKGLAENGRNKN